MTHTTINNWNCDCNQFSTFSLFVAGMCDGGLEEGIVAATRDDTTINAHDVVSISLHSY